MSIVAGTPCPTLCAGGTTQIVTPAVAPHGGVGVGVNVFVGVGVNVFVGVFVAVHGTPPTRHGVCVGVGVDVFVGVFVGVAVHGTPPTRHGVLVAVGVRVGLGVIVAVAVAGSLTLINPPAMPLIGMLLACGVSNVTSVSPTGLNPCASAVNRSLASTPNPSGPGGFGPSVTQVIRTSPVPRTMFGQFTARPLLPRKRLCTSFVNVVLFGMLNEMIDGSKVAVNSNAPRFVIPCAEMSILATDP
jgi:hypothetical protein